MDLDEKRFVLPNIASDIASVTGKIFILAKKSIRCPPNSDLNQFLGDDMLNNLASARPKRKDNQSLKSSRSILTVKNTGTSPGTPEMSGAKSKDCNAIPTTDTMIRQSSADSGIGQMWTDDQNSQYRVYHARTMQGQLVPVIYPGEKLPRYHEINSGVSCSGESLKALIGQIIPQDGATASTGGVF